jgi:hypothetical protein
MAIKKNKIDYHNSPAAWFCQLEIARNKEDFERAALAVRELKRLGVTVKFQGRTGKKLSESERALSKQKPIVLGGGTEQ